jgi:integrase
MWYRMGGSTRDGPQRLKDVKRLWHAVRFAAGLSDLRLHDLRHSFASVPASGGESLLIIRSMLGHARVATTERYAHLVADPVRRAADRASGDLGAWMAGANKRVTALRRRGAE